MMTAMKTLRILNQTNNSGEKYFVDLREQLLKDFELAINSLRITDEELSKLEKVLRQMNCSNPKYEEILHQMKQIYKEFGSY